MSSVFRLIEARRSSGAGVSLALTCGAVLALLLAARAPRATEEASYAVVERAGPVAPRTVALLDDPGELLALERELRELPPSTRGFPRWLVHVFAGPERQESYAIFDEDLERFPGIARAVSGEVTSERHLYRLELAGSHWERSGEVLATLAAAGERPVFYAGARSNWPYVEVVLTERVEEGLPPVEAGSPEEQEGRARFMERVGPLLRNKTANRTLDASYLRLADQLYRHHRELTELGDVRSFYATYRRYRWRGEGGARVAVRAEYRAPDRDSAQAIDAYFRDRATRSRGRLEPDRYGVELISTEPSVERLRAKLAASFPESIELRPGRPIVQ